MRIILVLTFLSLIGSLTDSSAQSGIAFTPSFLAGETLEHPTCLQFGPDNRLYVTNQVGEIYAYTVRKNGPNNYQITNTETILLVKQISNHDDRGNFFDLYHRQVTGLLVVGTAANPILYVTSSDPRIGGGGEGGDLDLDTNSGTLSKLTRSGGVWSKVDVITGLPRAEENHAPNGIQLDEANNILYIAQGGMTNAGSPSNNFAFITEYALSAAILRVDLNQINSQFGGSYVLPTLDDPTRANRPDGSDVNDPWGGNDGLNQAKIVPGGPVQVYSPGYRNIYDLLLTKTPGKSGRMYTIDNGANAGWGGFPENEGTPNVTNNRLLTEPGSTTPTMTDAPVNNLDNLHLITGQGYYGGHPNPVRANPAGAGLYWFDNATGLGHFELKPTVDWPPVPVSMAHPVESDFRNPGVNNGALWTTPYSTNGMAEYTASNFNGAMKGDVLAASFMGNTIVRLQFNANGTAVTNATDIFAGFGEFPLDVTAQGDNAIFPGTIWAITYTDANIAIFEPTTGIVCTGDINSFTLDDDGDGYSNGDETANGTDVCSPASKPTDFDQDHVSNLRDPDDDNDGIPDTSDKFAWDANNGTTTAIPLDYPFLNGDPGTGFFGVGVTGLMTNGVDNYAALYDPNDPALIVGGAVGAFSVPAQTGDATTNNQKYGFQFGVPISGTVGTFTMQGRILGAPFFNGATGSGLGTQSQGIYFGTGDQSNYFKFVLHANGGNPGFQILCEQNGLVVNQQIIPVANILSGSQIDLFIDVNVTTGVVQCRYLTNGNPISIGQSFTVSGNLLNLLQAHTNAVAIGLISSAGNKTPFSATWDYLRVTTTTAGLNVWQAVTYANGTAPDARHENGFVENNGKFYLVGGRGIKNVNIYDPVTKIWTNGAPTPIELHHFQAIVYQNKIYAINAMTGAYPTETPVANVYIYDIASNTWSTGATIPAERRRGSSGVVLYNSKFYLICGIQNGHTDGWVNWIDSYDPVSNTWTQLANAPQARDHFFAALLNGKIYAMAGRRTAQPNFAANTIAAVDVYDIASNTWSTPTSITTPRGAPGVAVVNNEIVVAGGEVDYQIPALSTVESYNTTTNSWTTKPSLNVGRHATQMINYNGNLYIAAGSTTQGDDGENNLMAFASFPSTPNNAAPFVAQAFANQSIPSSQSTLVVPLNTIFGDDNGVANLTYTVTSSNAALITSSPISNGQATLNLSGTTGTGTITLKATDAGGLSTPTTFQLTVTGTTNTLTNVIRINAGGPALTFGTETWVADQYFTAGTVYSVTTPIAGTTQDQIYQAERFGNMSYRIPVTGAGTYAVDLHFAEVYQTAIGTRLFNINVENGQFVRNNFDILQTAGAPNTALVVRADNLNVTDGFIDITFTTVLDNAKISGISVGKYSTAPANTAPVVAQAFPNQTVPSTQATVVVPLNTIFSDDGGVANLTYTLTSSNAALITSSPISNGQATLNLSGTTGTGTITLKATDAGGLSTPTTFQLTVTGTTNTLTNVIRINAGGPALTFGAETWVADQYFTGGTVYSVTTPIAGTVQDQIYQVERFGNMSYRIPVTGAGTYAVDLHFAEVYQTAIGTRLFNINIENGQFVRNNFDILQTAGAPNTALVVRADNLNVTDGFIDITFTTVLDNAKISGIAVGKYSTAPVNTAPVIAQAFPNQTVPSTQATVVVPLNTIFTDDGGVANLTYAVTSSNATLITSSPISNGQATLNLSGTTGTGTITLKATDAGGLSTPTTFQLTVTGTTNTLTNIIRINAGGSAQTFGTETWLADQYFTSGLTVSTTKSIDNTTQDQIYQSERYGNFSYRIPVPGAGTYAVDFHEAEVYQTQTGTRLFNVNVENGQYVRSNVDIIQSAGAANAAYVFRADNLNVTDGFIDIVFTTVKDNAKICGISVSKYSGNSAPYLAQAYGNQSVPSTQSSLIVPLNTIFGDDAGVNALTYTVTSSNAAILSSSPISNGQATLNLSGTTGTGTITLKATDAGNLSVQTTFQLTVTSSVVTLSNVIRIKTGGSALTFGTENWVADQYFTGGTVYSVTTPIAGTTQDQIYQSERFGNMSYHIPVSVAGSYAVDLHFAEVYQTLAGTRLFNINVENGQFVKNNLDLIQAAGGPNTAYVLRADNLNITDGFIDITFTTVLDNAKISGIAVGRYTASGTGRVAVADNTPIVTAPPNTMLAVGKSWSHQVKANDPRGQKLTYTSKNLPAPLFLDKNTGLISGTIESNPGVWPVTLTVTNESGLFAEARFLLTIVDQNYQAGGIAFILYPNPAERSFSVKLDSKKNETWSFVLTDVVGRPVDLGTRDLDEGVQVVDFDLRQYNLNAGMYFMQVQTKRGKRTIKVALK